MDVPKPARRPQGRPPKSLAPREHGAYGQLALPLVTALASRTPSLAAIAFAAAAVTGFALHEPVLVLLGRRGAKLRSESGARCRRLVVVLGGATASLGTVFLLLAPATARLAALLPLGLAAVVAGFVWRDREKTGAGEIIAAAALSSMAVPVALASGCPPATVATAWAAWCIGLGASTWAVRGVIARVKGTSRSPIVGLSILAGAVTVVLVVFDATPLIAATPMLAMAVVVTLTQPHPRHLRRVGWGLVAASCLTTVLLVAAAHA